MFATKYQRIEEWWYTRLPWYATPLLLLSLLYRFGFWLHATYWRFKKRQRFDVPLIVVGNISVGGTGKTPLVIYLAEELKKYGFNPGVVSRGYGGRSMHYPVVVKDDSWASEVGDESLMIYLRTHCPLVVDPNRPRAVKQLLRDFHCDVVISDDGLQHHALRRDVEIIVLDQQRGLGNGYSFPAGPLREPASRMARADCVVVNGGASHHLSGVQQVFSMHMRAKSCLPLKADCSSLSIARLQTQRLHAVVGIGHPQRFFNLLRELGLVFTEHVFADHYAYQRNDFDFLRPDEYVLMTEKDAVKCRHFADGRFYYLPITAVLPQDFISMLINSLS